MSKITKSLIDCQTLMIVRMHVKGLGSGGGGLTRRGNSVGRYEFFEYCTLKQY